MDGQAGQDTWILGGKAFTSRLIPGSGKYSSNLIGAALAAAEAEMITLALRRVDDGNKGNILDDVPSTVTVLPNTSGARTAEEAVRIARLARRLCHTDYIKVEIMRDSRYLLPDNGETIKATALLAEEGFTVMPYMFPDLTAARDMVTAGAACVMPLAAPIGSNKGLINEEWIRLLVEELTVPVIVDAGLGKPSDACAAMEMGVTAVMVNTAIATAGDTVRMAGAFKEAVRAGRQAYLARCGAVADGAVASSPLTGYLGREG